MPRLQEAIVTVILTALLAGLGFVFSLINDNRDSIILLEYKVEQLIQKERGECGN